MIAEFKQEANSLAEASAKAVHAVIESQTFPFHGTITTFSPDNAWEAVIEVEIRENTQPV